ncbi:amino acid ABC transporter substrate-binding protein [Ramlibacter sp.]|uniref:amino acid ABC transporter substrate-binding protein n=1 Tax=Ramlibacter sp. TaxID=1917967 RepID=UPI003D096BD1
MVFSTLRTIATAATLLLPVLAAAQANPTLDKILARGQIVIGHRTASPPLGYVADNGQVTGYSVEVCKYAAEHIKAALKRPDLKVAFVPVDASNRIPLVQNGTIDMECAGTSNTIERQKVVGFTYNILYIETRIAVRKSGPVRSAADLKGRSVAVMQGTVQQKLLAELDRARGLGVKPVLARDTAEGFLLLETGRADAAINDSLMLASSIHKSREAADFVFLPDWSSPPDVVSIMIAKGDDRFRTLANEGIRKMMSTGEFEKNYNRFFMAAPYMLPMPEPLRQQMRQPNDTGI